MVVRLPLTDLYPFPDHPFQVRDDEEMKETIQSVKEYGVIVPAIVRPREEGGYEIVAGHRRKYACEQAGLDTMPVLIRNLDRDAATIIMVDSNLQRENILPSERAKAYKMKLEAIKRQGARNDLTSPKISAKLRSDDEIGQQMGVSGDTVRNYISLTNLVPELMQMHHNEVPFNSKGKALLSGMVYCAHCGSKLVLTTSSGRRAKGEPKRETHIRYACHYKIRHPQDCDGQTGYSGEKLDGIIDKIVIQLFERMKTAPRSQLIQKQREKELQLANSSVANLEKLHAAAERELESYKKEIIKTINGTGSFGADILGEMIEDTRSKLAALAQELEQAKEKAADLKSSAVAVQKEYDKIMSWADLYAGSSIEGKKMILRQLIERVNIGRNFEIEVEFKISVTQFFDFLHPEGDKSVYYRAS
ncbi:ParB/RepB/Spo0J family partition protein [Pseudoflavonifractor sp. An184]|uniref:ParB/RepB/Spo0J family partition protein n=1 Tax=Pseudoflavonifractor sp. An184 TaxID=1965576 RepID=UPI0031BB7AB2